ncbi:MAG: class II aldolase/adducin family protein [Rhodocyclaceae bacterium]|nr:class II aldolase/adducin family protein [Rhodocyclaceae bacterium]
MNDAELRSQLLAAARGMASARLNVGTAGNASVRAPGGFLITPTGIPAETCQLQDLVAVTLAGEAEGRRAPSSEWRFHRDIYAARPEAGAVLHAHSPFATALACQGRDIPAFHYMIARFGGDTVRCAPYATFGTQALSSHALAALAGRRACLLAHHGMLVFGRDPAHALDLAIELETLCEHYWRTCLLGPPTILDSAQMTEVLEKFQGYGQPQPPQSGATP